ncbi:hypothetical protein COV61_01510 [Candidatus Micrarchaeota archaeon CG11_big_fil_rev_8_21_14_0_20_47_5]|nr:MAG: hypothetical protein AUJ17_00105 [Candidatus Micrarchaeota archaeon CG1_02_47_40]PIN83980.1 MAG: hypothetical protein COV61_01510 [Candidatus Micrarchaeota archaeon CG11_big_fil_rev_8_21_14_0_20_47_5]
MEIGMDRREEERVLEKLRGLGAGVSVSDLEIGDYILSQRVVCERKTRADFENSIIDGRLFRQLARMQENYERVLVVVEGENSSGRVSRNAMLGAYASILADFGAGVFFTKTPEATAELLFAIARYEQESKKASLPVFAKRKCLTLLDYQRAVVQSLPNIGPKMAEELLAHFGSVKNILCAPSEQICTVGRIGEKRARMIKNVIEREYESGKEGKTEEEAEQ